MALIFNICESCAWYRINAVFPYIRYDIVVLSHIIISGKYAFICLACIIMAIHQEILSSSLSSQQLHPHSFFNHKDKLHQEQIAIRMAFTKHEIREEKLNRQ